MRFSRPVNYHYLGLILQLLAWCVVAFLPMTFPTLLLWWCIIGVFP